MDATEKHIYDTYIKSGDVVYDIGAHIGETSLYFSTLKTKMVYAFEPSAINFPKLKSNTEMCNNITSFDVALNDKEYNCITKFKDCSNGSSDAEQSIKYVRIQKFIEDNKLEFPNFIKIDIEGMESVILNDFKFLFENSRPIIEMEIHAAPKNSAQDYEDNPHWRWIDQGGFDLNLLKTYNYYMLDYRLNLIDHSLDYNPKPGDHKHVVLIPHEKLS